MFSATQRPDQLDRLGRELFDLVIIGAGINGAAAARAAALRGYSVALVDQDDIAFGTSSRSSRLIHGGLRYLEHLELGLVFESLAERALLARAARHIVRPLRFVFPVYRGDRVSLLQARMGLVLYDMLALFRNYKNHDKLAPAEVSTCLPGVREAGLEGALGYYDYSTDDGRLVLENAMDAAEQGAVVVTRARVESIKNIKSGVRLKTLRVRDLVGQQEMMVTARAVLCAAGPWTDEVLGTRGDRRWLRPTKGVHIVVPRERLAVDCAVVLQHPSDRRVLFALPFYEHTVFGTTDTDFDGDPGRVSTTAEDVRYLLDAARHYFPSAHLRAEDVISTWAGVRPLVAADSDDPSAVSREERIEALKGGIVAVAGGKLTTYRRIAAACLDAVAPVIMESGGPLPKRPAPEEKGPLPGAVGLETEEKLERLRGELTRRVNDPAVARQLSHSYGVRAREVLELSERRPRLGERIVPELPLIWAQVVFAARAELALTLGDVLIRRTQLCYRDAGQGLDVAGRAAVLLAEELGWDADERERQIQDYREQIAQARPAGARIEGRPLHV
jgi:glycerol-3-phosphate dehydrogenase